jgi:predicted transcriptional regulator of viral defense system
LQKTPKSGILRKKSLNMATANILRLPQWTEYLQSRGRHAFSWEELQQALPEHSAIALKRALNRLAAQNKIVSLHKGYYLIVPPQYAAKGILPPAVFLDAFMKHLHRPYYLALLNAAAYHGAAHQQTQEFFVVTNFPPMRTTQKKGLKINYISIGEIPGDLLEQRKTESGYLLISNPALTAADLVHFEKRIGGLNRVVEVLDELSDAIAPSDFSAALISFATSATLQRLGYLLEFVCGSPVLADALFAEMQTRKILLYRTPLKPSQLMRGFDANNRWQVIVNAEVILER